MTQVEYLAVERKLGAGAICSRCGATLASYGEKCSASLAEACPGFVAIENALKEAEGE